MGDTVEMSRQAAGVEEQGTVNTKTLSIAFMEFLSTADSNAIKSQWLSYGFKDVSPLWGDEAAVKTFKDDKATIARWSEFQQAMAGVEADWYYISGHHGRQFKSDGEGVAAYEHYRDQEHTGFFNEPYHMGVWHHDNPDNPAEHASTDDVYMTMTEDDGGCDMGPTCNPLFQKVHSDCKGVLLIGCNSLIYSAPRKMLAKYFPNALMIGLMGREGNAMGRLLPVIQGYGREFFTNPDSIDAEELAWKLNPGRFAPDKMGVVKGGMLNFIVREKIYMIGMTQDLEEYMLKGGEPPNQDVETDEDPYE